LSLHRQPKLRAGTALRYVLDEDREAGALDRVFLLNVLSVDASDQLSEAVDAYVQDASRQNYRRMLEIAVAGHQVPDCDEPVTAIVTKAEGMELIRACRDANNLSTDERKKFESQHTSLVESSAGDVGASAATAESA